MANEIKVTAALQCNKGNFELPLVGRSPLNVNQNGVGGGYPGVIDITTTAVQISFTGYLTSPGYCRIQNLDTTNYIQVGTTVSATFHPLIRLKPGEACVFRLDATANLTLKADTATCRVSVITLED